MDWVYSTALVLADFPAMQQEARPVGLQCWSDAYSGCWHCAVLVMILDSNSVFMVMFFVVTLSQLW